jgi:hypothetical protein
MIIHGLFSFYRFVRFTYALVVAAFLVAAASFLQQVPSHFFLPLPGSWANDCAADKLKAATIINANFFIMI